MFTKKKHEIKNLDKYILYRVYLLLFFMIINLFISVTMISPFNLWVGTFCGISAGLLFSINAHFKKTNKGD